MSAQRIEIPAFWADQAPLSALPLFGQSLEQVAEHHANSRLLSSLTRKFRDRRQHKLSRRAAFEPQCAATQPQHHPISVNTTTLSNGLDAGWCMRLSILSRAMARFSAGKKTGPRIGVREKLRPLRQGDGHCFLSAHKKPANSGLRGLFVFQKAKSTLQSPSTKTDYQATTYPQSTTQYRQPEQHP